MIYNFVEYLKTQFPTETFCTNMTLQLAGQDEIPDRRALVKETGGPRQMKTGFARPNVQILCYDIDAVSARELADQIYEDLWDRNGLLLPAVTVNGILYPQVETGAIRAIQSPYFIGMNDSGLAVWSINFEVTFTER